MGSDLAQNEGLPHNVTLQSFWIDKTEVTNAMYVKCVEDNQCDPPDSKNSNSRGNYYGKSEFNNYPVIFVSWSDAKAYCTWVGRRLPTEAEWEKAASWKESTKEKYLYPWGNASPNNDLLNFNNALRDTTEVGYYPDGASPYGALDMAGNVWEWVNDWYDESYYSNSKSTDPQGPLSGQSKVLRGGSWKETYYYVRSSRRIWDSPTSTHSYMGFRCAMSASK
jgi:serine/threonine-protein kinase